ncbi:MAG TPA: hypothetical protein VHM65_08505 [Candidatus Lustribacter sp.]|nr:hypothetical protein [Candidatus Lustribacter sp.]
MTTYLLGPQRFATTAGTVVRGLGQGGPVATVTSGWEEREGNDAELHAVLEGRSRNLHLYARLLDVIERDHHFARAAMAFRDAVDELGGFYSVRLHHAAQAVVAVHRRTSRLGLGETALDESIAAVRAVDDWYSRELMRLYGELEATAPAGHSDVVMHHRHEVASILQECTAVAVAGGHVGMLLRTLRLFAVAPAPDQPVVAWSAGAMAMTRRVVLFHDFAPHGYGLPEVWDRGTGRVPGVVALPHARRRLRLDDPVRMMLFARRFADCTCVLLDDGVKLAVGPDGELPPGTRYLAPDGSVALVGAR